MLKFPFLLIQPFHSEKSLFSSVAQHFSLNYWMSLSDGLLSPHTGEVPSEGGTSEPDA